VLLSLLLITRDPNSNKRMSISDWGDVLRTGSNGPPNTKGMSSHSPFECSPKKCSVGYQLQHQEEDGEWWIVSKRSFGDLSPANTITASNRGLSVCWECLGRCFVKLFSSLMLNKRSEHFWLGRHIKDRLRRPTQYKGHVFSSSFRLRTQKYSVYLTIFDCYQLHHQ